jgi:hypothetical protein
MGAGQPNAPSPFLADVGKGRFVGRRAYVLQRFEGDGWREVGRFGSMKEASSALDDAMAGGAQAGTLRLTPVSASNSARLLYAVGVVLFVALVVAIVAFWVLG